MADITMCTGNDCPIKFSCYRFTAPSNPYGQSMIDPPGYYRTRSGNNLDAVWHCEMFWDNTGRERREFTARDGQENN